MNLLMRDVHSDLFRKKRKKDILKVVVSDLDRTLLYSTNIDKNYETSVENTCVEMLRDKPFSFMTKKAKYTLENILKHRNTIFVPCTMRSFEQLQRISFLKTSKYVICYNGCELYIDGVLNEKYSKYVEKYLEKEKIKEMEEKYTLKYPNLKVKSYKDFYLEIKTPEFKERNIIVADILKEMDLHKFKVILSDTKVYIMPNKVDKQIAVKYLKTFLLSGVYFAMGDNIVDKNFLNNSDYAFIPKHASFVPLIENTYESEFSNIKGGEDILIKLYEILKEDY